MSKILIDEATVKLALEALRSMANTLAEHQEPTTFYEDEAMRALKALAEQPAPVQEPVEWVDGATHYQPHQRAFYKRVSATEWYVWSRVEQEPLHWCKALGTSDSAHWILRQPAQQEPVAWISEIRCIGPEYGKKRYSDLPIQSLQPGYYAHTPLYTTPQAQPAPEIAIADAYRVGVDSGIAAEREACAKVCESQPMRQDIDVREQCAAAIRARGNT